MTTTTVSVDRASFRAALRTVESILPARSLIPHEITGTWLTVDDTSITLATTIGWMSVATRVPAVVTGDDAQAAVHGGWFARALRRPLPPLADAATRLQRRASMVARGFEHVTLSLGHRHGWLAKAEGLELVVDDHVLRMAATDLHQLAEAELSIDDARLFDTGDAQRAVIPPWLMNMVARTVPDTEDVVLAFGDGRLDIEGGPFSLRIRLLPAAFPDCSALRAAPHPRRVAVALRDLATALKRTSLVTTKESAEVWFTIGEGELRVEVVDRDRGEARDRCPARLVGAPGRVGFHLWPFVAAVNLLRGDVAHLELAERDDKPARLSTGSAPGLAYHLLPLATDPPPSRLAALDQRGAPAGPSGASPGVS